MSDEKVEVKIEERKSVRQELDDLKTMLQSPEKIKDMVEQSKQYKKFMKKQKNFKIPSKYIRQAKKSFKTNKILIILLRSDRNIQLLMSQRINGMVYIEGKPHDASVDFVFMYKNVPVLIIPEWSLVPIGTNDYYEAVKGKRTTEAATIILRAIEARQNEMLEKKKMSFGIIIWILIGAAVIFGFFFMNKK